MQKHVLIVDDTKNIRLMLTKCLELEGYHVETASNGKEGLEAILAGQYDLVFLDIKLPEISGTEVLRRMRAAGITSRVVIITAYPTIKNAVECTRLGVVSYLQKPFTATRLRALLSELDLAGESLERRLALAREALERENPARALSLLQAALGENPCCGAVYALLSDAYALAGDNSNSEKFRTIAALFD